TIAGVPGIGKTRLVTELYAVLEREAELTNWRQGRSLPYGEGIAFWAFAEMVKAQAGILDTDDTDAAGGKLRETAELAGADAPCCSTGGRSGAAASAMRSRSRWRRSRTTTPHA